MFNSRDLIILAIIIVYATIEVSLPAVRAKMQRRKLNALPKDKLPEYIDELIEKERRRQHIAGMAVGIVRNGSVILSKGYGFASLEEPALVTDETIFRLASVSKHMVAVCVMILAEQGKLQTSDSVRKYLPDVPEEWHAITIRHLLQLSSGLRRESPAYSKAAPQPLDALISSLYSIPLAFVPGSKWQYSNMSYFVLARIIEKVTGESFEQYANKLFAGLGLQDTATTNKKSQRQAVGYRYRKYARKHVPAADFSDVRPSGAFSSSMRDMLRWDAFLFQSNKLSAEHWRQTWQDTILVGPYSAEVGSPLTGAIMGRMTKKGSGSRKPKLYYGYGWGVTMYRGRTLLTHGGGSPGFTADYWKFIDDKTSIIILSNTYGRDLGSISRQVYEAIERMG